MHGFRTAAAAILLAAWAIVFTPTADAAEMPPLRLHWQDNILSIRGPQLPGGELKVWYLEAYCRPGSTDREWGETVIGHQTRLVSADPDGRSVHLRCTLRDGVTVDHHIRSTSDEVSFELSAHNPTAQKSQAHWAQPCVRVDKFTGTSSQRNSDEYLRQSFIFHENRLTRLPDLPAWATRARYTPGQVWCPAHVDRGDVNPRPLSPLVPSNGLIGCYSADGKKLLAMAWEPYQELFQGIIVCLHSDFRIGGLEPGQTKPIRGKMYVLPADEKELLRRYVRDFPEHQPKADR